MKYKKYWYCIRLMMSNPHKHAAYIKNKCLLGGGNNVYFHPWRIPADPKHVFIGNNVKIASGVIFINHDISCDMLNEKYHTKAFKYWLRDIIIEDNVFVGANAIILPGITIHSNSIIGAGCVVSKDVPEGTVVAGNPMRKIGNFDDFVRKRSVFP